jgi:hypothetical protein
LSQEVQHASIHSVLHGDLIVREHPVSGLRARRASDDLAANFS